MRTKKFFVLKKGMNDLLRYLGTQILQIDAIFPAETFVFLGSGTRFLLSNPLSWPGAKQGHSEALAPGHGQGAPWPYRAIGAMSSCRHGARCDWARKRCGGQRGVVESECICWHDNKFEKQSYLQLLHPSTDPDISAFRTDKLARGYRWCMHSCVGVCGILTPFYTGRLVASS